MKTHSKKILSGMLSVVMSSCLIGSCLITGGELSEFSHPVYAADYNKSVISPDSISESDTNIEYQNYRCGTWDYFNYSANPIESYIVNTDDNYLMTFQPGKDGNYIASYYSSDYKLVKTRTIKKELDKFGGFYNGSDGYYIISGQNNPDESEAVECFRITKYDKNWNRLSSDGLYNCNTISPFSFGSLRVAENGNYLVIRTCHLMYKSSDGLNHQANVTIEYSKQTSEITRSFAKVEFSGYGYASHSFNQFIIADGNNFSALDHGDAYPRSIVLTKCNSSSGYPYCKQIPVISFSGQIGANYTGATVGGFECSDSSYLIAGSSEEDPGADNDITQRNIFIAAVSKSNNRVKTNYLTDNFSKAMTSTTPQLVKINDNRFVLIWTTIPYTINEMKYTGEINYAELDGNGNVTGDIHKATGYISDCHPIVKDGKAVWYVYNGARIIFYTLDPDTMEVKQNAVVDPTGITLSKTAVTINKGSKSTIAATIAPVEATDKTVTWTSSDKSIATVSNGTITAQSAGKATITAKTFNGKTASCTVTVVINPTKINLSKTTLSIQKGSTAALTASVLPADSTDKTVTWTTSNSKVAAVSGGKVTAVSAGKATITAKTSNGKTASCTVTVTNPPVAVTAVFLNKTSMTLGKGETIKLTAAVAPSDATNKTIAWRTSDSKILTVDKSGNVKAVNNGTAWITAKASSGIEKSCKIIVKNAPDKITLTKGIVTIGVGESFTLGSGINDGAGCATRTYRTSNSSIAKMTRTDWNGVFVGVKPGVAYITVKTYNGKESTCKVTVKKAPQSVSLSKTAMTLKVGQTGSLSAIIASDAGCAARTFRTSNSSVVKITKTNWTGEFKAVKKGVAYVTVRTYNGKEASCKVTVV